MVRRVSWIGLKNKDIEGDCIIVNFRDRRVVRHVIGRGYYEPVTEITPLPLEYFYPRSDLNRCRYLATGAHGTTRDMEKHTVLRAEGPGYPGQSFQYLVPVRNRYDLLDSLECVD